jgi:regulator of RNase E activity RraA
MFVVNPMPAPLVDSSLTLLRQAETATIGHFRHACFLDRAIQPVLPQHRIAGTAVTVRIAAHDSAMLHYVINLVRPGDVVVVDRCGDDRHACWGGGVSAAMKFAGVAGGVVDGPATDFSEIRELDFPLWCRGASPITTKLVGLESAINVPVSVGGVVIRPGDAVLADESGVVVLAPEEVDEVARTAIGKQEAGVRLVERLRNGEKIADISGATAMIEKGLGRA